MKINNILFVLILLLIFYMYRAVFLSPIIAGGDYISPQYTFLLTMNYPFSAWDTTAGLGWATGPLLHYAPMDILLNVFHSLSPQYGERVVWWGLFFILSFFSSEYLFRSISKKPTYQFLSPLIYMFNTYILLIISGGQIAGIGLAYALLPLVIALFYNVLLRKVEDNVIDWRLGLIYSMLLAIEIVFDIRFAYICVCSITLLLLLYIPYIKLKKMQTVIALYIVPLCIAGLVHAFWILPSVLFHQNPIDTLGSAYNSTNAVTFLSFAKLENTLSLLHPNWPENMFGKTYFMRPEFLLFPLLAFASLFLISKTRETEEKRAVLFLALIGLIGAFLAKGANDPFGSLYVWFFNHVPGFVMFRDSTKWYSLIAVSYATLIPYTLNNLSLITENKFKSVKNLSAIFVIIFVGFIIWTVKDAVLGKVGGTLAMHSLPAEYSSLTQFLRADTEYSRTLWIPTVQRYGYFSIEHPAINGYDLFGKYTTNEVIAELNSKNAEKQLQDLAVNYVIVPDDTEGEIFLRDRKYDVEQHTATVNRLNSISWLTKVPGFGNIAVYRVPSVKDHFWLTATGQIAYTFVDATSYQLHFSNVTKGETVVFSESYDKNWQLKTDNQTVRSSPFQKQLNSFILPESGSYTVAVYYLPQRTVNYGLIISGITFFVVVGSLVYLQFHR